MDYLTVGLLALIALLIAATLWLGWRLRTRPLLKVEAGKIVAVPTPPPAFIKCNTRHFIFKRTDDTGAEVQGDVWRHPYCEHLDLLALTDEYARESWLGGHPEPGWKHAETRDEVHFVKP